MINVGNKPDTLRTARASGRLLAPVEVLERIRGGTVEKGDCLQIARVAGIQAAKRTDDLIPLCHPLPIHAAEVAFEVTDEAVLITAEAAVIGPTGVEMEAMAAVSAAALTIYDMVKMYCEPDDLVIDAVKLIRKTGGKSQFTNRLRSAKSALVLVLSDTVAAGRKPDTAGQAVRAVLEKCGFEPLEYAVMSDDAEPLLERVRQALDDGIDCIMTVGGTGISPRDITVDTLAPLITTPMPGIMEAGRAFGQRRTPYALMSRGVAGLAGPRGRSLIMTLPGSRGGATETLQAVLPGLIHLFDCRDAFQHAGGYE
ncbi:bifunctional molybdenum cofactor biosynthesis protein MoaC/MoaB [uncultured Abyssibacter sp.]|uniref:bifunctional molybdenum cofactor biosynthesis protein MoaC/MoaB n=1 Tax=uncultured Abyssibacter sp. TaxID=2320202 RepID=UPI0032B21305